MMLSGMQNVLEKDINYMENSLLLSVLSKDKRERKRKYFSLFKQNVKMKEQ